MAESHETAEELPESEVSSSQDLAGEVESLFEVPQWWSDWLTANPLIAPSMELAVLMVAALLTFFVTRRILRPTLTRLVQRTKNTWDDILVSSDFINWISWVPVTAVLNYGVLLTSHLPSWSVEVIRNVSRSLTLVMVLLAVGALLTGINAMYSRLEIARSRPIKGYVQIVKIILYSVGGLAAIALLVDQSPWNFLAGIGAMTAILLLIFKDTILSLVASITVMSNDMVRVGDWIEIRSAGVDGDVVDLSLHTVKIQNFDRTVSYLPTHRLVSETVKNWRGMQEAGGRRIMRSITIDLQTVRFLNDEEVDRYARYHLLKEYIAQKREVLKAWNEEHGIGPENASDARRLTNLGTLRAYIINYLKNRPDIHQEGSGLMFLVRQLQTNEHGVPLEIYVFTTTTRWVEYECIQADIFDHILAMVPELGLRVFQEPSGADVTTAARAIAGNRRDDDPVER
ncbi:MAG: mechanosensitive ion channel family protein [Planctomycetota bacterium]|nr:MAG: mechanosensitive ion channel family protein [Planctomycetota bacterium]